MKTPTQTELDEFYKRAGITTWNDKRVANSVIQWLIDGTYTGEEKVDEKIQEPELKDHTRLFKNVKRVKELNWQEKAIFSEIISYQLDGKPFNIKDVTLAYELGMDKGTISKFIGRLEKKGLINKNTVSFTSNNGGKPKRLRTITVKNINEWIKSDEETNNIKEKKIPESVKEYCDRILKDCHFDIDVDYCIKHGIKFPDRLDEHDLNFDEKNLFNSDSNKKAFDYLTKIFDKKEDKNNEQETN